MQRTQIKVNSLKEQLRRKDEAMEAERSAVAERECRSQEALAEALIRQVVNLEEELAASRRQAGDASTKDGALEVVVCVRERERELERSAATFRVARLEERIGVYERDAQIAADQIAVLEAENQRLRDQAASYDPARDLWSFGESQLDVYKKL